MVTGQQLVYFRPLAHASLLRHQQFLWTPIGVPARPALDARRWPERSQYSAQKMLGEKDYYHVVQQCCRNSVFLTYFCRRSKIWTNLISPWFGCAHVAPRHSSSGPKPLRRRAPVRGNLYIRRYVPSSFMRLYCWSILVRGCIPAHKHCNFVFPISGLVIN